jgi:hypothetical protein
MMSRSSLVLCLCAFAALTAGCGCASKPAADPAKAAVVADPVKPADPAKPADPVDPAKPAPVENHGGCDYAKIAGTCTVMQDGASGVMVFTGTIDGKAVTLPDNAMSRPEGVFVDAKVGTAGPCTIEFETHGTCTPCMFSIGDCGQAAWEAFRNYHPGT